MTKQYERFLGKVCTILTGPVSFPFSNGKQHAEYFSGLVTEVSNNGILIKHLNTNTHAFYTFPIVGVVEEQTIDRSHPDYDKIKAELEQKKKPAPIQKPAPQINLSIEELTRQAKQAKLNQKDIRQSSSSS